MTNKQFIYEEIDNEGLYTLNLIGASGNFNKWMYEAIQPYLRGNILEVGSGIGNITALVIDDKFNVTASDIRKNYCDILENRFNNNPFFKGVKNIDIVHPDFDRVYADLLNQFDSIFALNIIEHVENDTLAFKNCKKFLRQNGSMIVLVPAHQKLYNSFDIELKHYRRYSKSSLEDLFQRTGLKICKTQYFNFIGIFGWWLSGSVFGFKTIPAGQMRLYNKLVPLIRLVDKLLMKKIGLSVITIGTIVK